MRRLVPLIALALAMVTTPATQAVERAHGVYSGRSVTATFTGSIDCLTTEVFVFGLANRIQWLPGTPYEDANLWRWVTQDDTCTGQRTFYGPGYLSGAAVTVEPSLRAASVQGSVQVYNWVNFSWVTLDVDLGWEAAGGRARESSHETVHGSGYVAFYHYSGTSQPAMAFGSVTLGEQNLTPMATGAAVITSTREGELFVAPHNEPD
ncbi:MAG: hypothetical protein M3121_04260 [Chloroflexota bacterium]|nr:hypothetical protein [Chloroflexota bacterium]